MASWKAIRLYKPSTAPISKNIKPDGQSIPVELEQRIAQTRADYDRWLDAKYAAARGHCDALIDPLDTRQILSLAFDAACFESDTEHVPIQLLSEVQL